MRAELSYQTTIWGRSMEVDPEQSILAFGTQSLPFCGMIPASLSGLLQFPVLEGEEELPMSCLTLTLIKNYCTFHSFCCDIC